MKQTNQLRLLASCLVFSLCSCEQEDSINQKVPEILKSLK